jgi:prepilin-type N-terminal cleavage/methylation domain-containing protein
MIKNKLKLYQLNQLSKTKINKGFTLIELLIVILITGVMPAIVMPWLLDNYDLHKQQVHSDG